MMMASTTATTISTGGLPRSSSGSSDMGLRHTPLPPEHALNRSIPGNVVFTSP